MTAIIIALVTNVLVSLFGMTPIMTTWEELPEQRNGQLYVVVEENLIDENLIGHNVESGDMYGYTSYERMDFQTGDIVLTFLVMNPYSEYDDDIVYRFDFLEGNINNIVGHWDGAIE